MCEARALEDFDGARYHIALVSRRGRLHVGPRYKARGINEPYAEPANEIECEQARVAGCGGWGAVQLALRTLCKAAACSLAARQHAVPLAPSRQIIWRMAQHAHRAAGAGGARGPTPDVQWSRYTWRRGSVPLWWGVSIKNQGIGEAEIKIRQGQTFKGSRR
jgi:hypothetical protein